MTHVNWGLLALAFVLGLVLTLASMIRRVEREVPVYGAVGRSAAAKVARSTSEEPYGAGSFRLASGSTVPSGWTIKGNEDSMLYHTTDSPAYEQTVAELWFRDAETAEAAGFDRWDSGKSHREK